MKILYKNKGFGGGAPRSLLEYAKIAKKNNIDVLAVGDYTHSPEYYHKNRIKTFNIPHFSYKKPFRNLYAFIQMIILLKNERPDIIHVTTHEQCVFQRVISKLFGIPTVYTLPGGKTYYTFAKIMNNDNVLVFSQENKDDLLEFGYDESKIKLISNRIKFPVNNECNIKQYNVAQKKVNFLFIGRIESNYNAIKSLLNIVILLLEKGIEIELKVLGDGNGLPELKVIAEEINKKENKDVVNFLGFISNVKPYINEAHIVFGKGRSIIDAIANLRISFVSAETGEHYLTTPSNISLLSKYNFAGRNNDSPNTFDDIHKLVIDIVKCNYRTEMLYKTKEITQELYDIERAEDKILKLYKNEFIMRKEKRLSIKLISSIWELGRIYYIYFKSILIRNLIK